MRIDILTLFPRVFETPLQESMLRIAQEKGCVQIYVHDIRTYTTNKHGKVDDRPFGGGPGMVLCCQPVIDAVEAVQRMAQPPGRLFFLSPEGVLFSQPLAENLSKEERILLVCGHYEGFDERIFEILHPEILSIGDYILSGGEIAALVVVDAVVRLLPHVLGDPHSLDHESFSIHPDAGNRRLLDYPHYTQPAVFRGLAVPEVLRSGDHAKIAAWRREQALLRTQRLRPALLKE